jgi:hypothetical protein
VEPLEDKRKQLVALLGQCSAELRTGQNSNAPLRRLQDFVRPLLYVRTDPDVRTIAFILDEWIKDYYLNFAGDIMSSNWSDVDKIRNDLLSEKTAIALARLAESVVSGPDRAFHAIEHLVVSYLDAIEEANEAVGRG